MEVLELSCTRGLSSEDALQVREAMRGQQLGRQAASVRSIRDFERECGDLGVPKTSLLSFYGLVQKRRRAFSESDEFPPPPVVRSSSSKSPSLLLRLHARLKTATPTAGRRDVQSARTLSDATPVPRHLDLQSRLFCPHTLTPHKVLSLPSDMDMNRICRQQSQWPRLCSQQYHPSLSKSSRGFRPSVTRRQRGS